MIISLQYEPFTFSIKFTLCESNTLCSVIIKTDSAVRHIVCQLFFFHDFVTLHEQ